MNKKISLLLSLMLFSNMAFAEGGCPPGEYPANPPAVNVCYPIPEDSQPNY